MRVWRGPARAIGPGPGRRVRGTKARGRPGRQACNSVRHGGGRGSIALWAHDGHAVVEVADSGLIADPPAGRRRPDFRSGGGAGLWTANQLCDLVLIHSTAESSTIRGRICS